MDAITSRLLDKIVDDTSPVACFNRSLNEFRQLAVLSYVYLLRTSDEAIPLRRGIETDSPVNALRDVKGTKRHSAVSKFQQALGIARSFPSQTSSPKPKTLERTNRLQCASQ
ncbi:hypothetical protein DIPPA_20304 [Diplonema papillatum]|nr:hypothetical protein DIPPA_20304 [Diplonema papillatum]